MRPSGRTLRCIAAAASAAFVLSLASCVSLAADAEVRADGSVSVRLDYRVSRLVEAMGKVEGKLCEQGPDTPRDGYFACVLAIAWPDGTSAVYEGRAPGTLTWPPRGTLGFGYDPVFVPTGGTRTFAELDPEEKHRISHRADAFAKLVAEQFPE